MIEIEICISPLPEAGAHLEQIGPLDTDTWRPFRVLEVIGDQITIQYDDGDRATITRRIWDSLILRPYTAEVALERTRLTTAVRGPFVRPASPAQLAPAYFSAIAARELLTTWRGHLEADAKEAPGPGEYSDELTAIAELLEAPDPIALWTAADWDAWTTDHLGMSAVQLLVAVDQRAQREEARPA